MGFRHRVYKNYDPRAKVIKRYCDKILANLKKKDPLLEVAKKLEAVALEDSYFIEKKLFPNVDFYSGIILKSLNIPTYMYVVIFALARTSGWMSQYIEMYRDKRIVLRIHIYAVT